MGLVESVERNSFRDCLLRGLRESGIRYGKTQLKGQDDLALVLRPFELPVDISYGIRSMYHGYPYHVGILYNGMVYNYMPDMDKLLTMKLGEAIHVDTLREFCEEAIRYCDHECEVYYIHSTGRTRSEIIARLIWMLNIKNGTTGLRQFNNQYGTTLSEYYNLFLNNCEHFAMSVLAGSNFSCQEELIDSDLHTYKKMLLGYEPQMPHFGKIWLNEYYSVMGK
uniref:Lecithin retinol acyltransferase n=1 Tax=Pithovirus LCPAC101 TaxID=2506586 RepID=A0A481Z3U8_9VIRU|nr:MAG: hypothetical protein LCPAC101_03360 [Pithovirus LCPAC101]